MKHENVVYNLPCRSRSLYVNITAACLNECLFCIKRKGELFFGASLSLPVAPTASAILASLRAQPLWEKTEEVVFCGMGEPLLEYSIVTDACRTIKDAVSRDIVIRIDTSGLFWAQNTRLNFLNWIDVLSISLNAESAEKYEALCQPTIPSAYDVLMDFLRAVKSAQVKAERRGRHFPEVRLSVVDTSEEEFIPECGRKGYARGCFPIPDFDACRRIAVGFGWQFVVKRLFRDSCDDVWNDPEIQDMCARGIALERCQKCTYRH